MSKIEIREIDVETLRDFLRMYTPEAEITLYNGGIDIDHEGFSWLISAKANKTEQGLMAHSIGRKHRDKYPIYSPKGEIIAECLNYEDAEKIIIALDIYDNIKSRLERWDKND